MKRLDAILITVIFMSLPFVSYGGTLSGFGKATIDGKMGAGEWDKAAKIDFPVNVPGGGTTPATLYVMNDEENIYLALKYAQSSLGKLVNVIADFDNDNDGTTGEGEDSIGVKIKSPSILFVDLYRSADARIDDTSAEAGSKDGNAAASNDGTVTIIEMWHPLKSTDTMHDFSLNMGSVVGFRITMQLIPAPESGTNYEQVKIASQAMQAEIDIKPGSRDNNINSGSAGKIPVAVISNPDFNALALVDRSSLTFGHAGDEKSLAFCNAGGEDVNGDGLPDLVCHFFTKLTKFQTGDVSGMLKGCTTDGTIFTAEDSVRIVNKD